MIKNCLLLLVAGLVFSACGNSQSEPPGDPAKAAADIRGAVTAAKAAHKRVLIEAGGDACDWCKTMRLLYESNPTLGEIRDKNYVSVRVNLTGRGPLPDALQGSPPRAGYPHLYILDKNGSLIQSQDTSEFEKGDGYDLEKFSFFLKAFGPPKQ